MPITNRSTYTNQSLPHLLSQPPRSPSRVLTTSNTISYSVLTWTSFGAQEVALSELTSSRNTTPPQLWQDAH